MRCLLDVATFSFALLLRISVGFHPHSGQDDYQGTAAARDDRGETAGPVKYGGDYEAQRHWMEVTYHLPLSEWYYHDLEYWGLDYPPLTAYVSWALGWVAHNVGSIHDGVSGGDRDDGEKIDGACLQNDAACAADGAEGSSGRRRGRGLGVLRDLVALHSSRWGFEEPGGKIYMRFTVLLLDALVYMSAVWALAGRLAGDNNNSEEEAVDHKSASPSSTGEGDEESIIPASQMPRLRLLLVALCQPALILIDHGHFQYNTTSLGLALWSFHFMTTEDAPGGSFAGPILGSVLFGLALNFKQMELYHAPAVFAYLLGRCLRRDADDGAAGGKSTGRTAIGRFCALGIAVVLAFAALWAPFAMHPRPAASPGTLSRADGIVQILRRLFPFGRGIFEGKVANLWCALSVRPVSLRDRLPPDLLPLAALGLTLALILPPCRMLFLVGRGNGRGGAGADEGTERKRDDKDVRLLLWGAACTSLAFFLASFQVHEKGILIPLAPLSLLVQDAPRLGIFFSVLSTWSLWPLLVVDRLGEAYTCCLTVFLCVESMTRDPCSPGGGGGSDVFSDRYAMKCVPPLAYAVMILLHVAEWFVAPPGHLPDLFPVLWSVVGCGLFCMSYLAMVWAMTVQVMTKQQVK